MKKITIMFAAILFFLSSTPVFANQTPKEPIISTDSLFMYSKYYVLMDKESGLILSQKDHETRIHPASITKVLTTITAIEMLEEQKIPLNEMYQIPEEVITGVPRIASTAGFKPLETVSIQDILHGVILPSGADATRAISMRLTQNPEGLAEPMNALAEKIGMTQSHFVNTSGLDEDGHYSTAYDLAKLVQYALKNDTFKKLYETVHYTTTATPENPKGLEFTNLSLEHAQNTGDTFMKGAKSGYTEGAERALSSYAKNGNTELIFVSVNAPNEEKPYTPVIDALTMYQRVFTDFKRVVPIPSFTTIDEINIAKTKTKFPVQLPYDVVTFIPKEASDADLKIAVKPLNAQFSAPVEASTEMARVEVRYKDKLLATESIVNPNLIAISFSYKMINVLKYTIGFLLALLLLLLFVGFTIRQYHLHKIRKNRKKRNIQNH